MKRIFSMIRCAVQSCADWLSSYPVYHNGFSGKSADNLFVYSSRYAELAVQILYIDDGQNKTTDLRQEQI